MTQIAVIGAGNVGSTLGKRLRDAGHTVRWGVRDPGNPKYGSQDVTNVATAVLQAELVIIAVPWTAAENAVLSAGDLCGKIVVDATNPIAADFSGLLDLGGMSAAEHIAAWAPGAAVVKAFNTIGFNVMENPQFGNQRASLLIAGDDPVAKAKVIELASQIGFDPVDTGALTMARCLEAFAWIWISLAVKQGYGRDIVLNVIKR